MESDNEKQEREKQAIIAKMNAANEENQKSIKAERETHEEDVDHLTREKAELRCDQIACITCIGYRSCANCS